MHARRKLSVTVAALIVSTQLGSSFGSAAPSPRQIATLQDHLSTQDYDAMADYLATSPDLLSDDSALARVLGDFLASYRAGSFTAFSAGDLALLEDMMIDACRESTGASATRDCSIY